MKRLSVRLLALALCLCFTAPLCVGCAFSCPPISLFVSASAPSVPLEDYLTSALMNEEETIDLIAYRIDEKTLHATYSALYATNPDLFFLSAEYGFSKDLAGCVAYLRPIYRLRGDKRREAAYVFRERVCEIVSPVKNLTALEKTAYLHDYMITRFTYDNNYTVYDAYTLLMTGRGVCQAYALLFVALAREAGLESTCVTCFERSHEWNAVKLGNDWYHIDLVWDDTDVAGEVLHTYFLIGDAEMRTRRAMRDETWDTEYTWIAPAEAADIYAAPWRRLNTPFFFSGDGVLAFCIGTTQYRLFPDLSCVVE